ncbi:MAG: hypothetical protein ACE5DI_01420 [Candidatus Micrarchaeia archaeon]
MSVVDLSVSPSQVLRNEDLTFSATVASTVTGGAPSPVDNVAVMFKVYQDVYDKYAFACFAYTDSSGVATCSEKPSEIKSFHFPNGLLAGVYSLKAELNVDSSAELPSSILVKDCFIQGAYYSEGDENSDGCKYCDAIEPYLWTVKANGTACSFGFCFDGICTLVPSPTPVPTFTPTPVPTFTPTPVPTFTPTPVPTFTPTPVPTFTPTPVPPTPTPTPSPTPSPTQAANNPPQVSLLEPSNGSWFNSTPLFEVFASDAESSLLNCSVYVWPLGRWDERSSVSNSAFPSGGDWQASLSQDLADGSYEWMAQCVDEQDGISEDVFSPPKFSIDSTAPSVGSVWPSEVVSGTLYDFYANVSDEGVIEGCAFHAEGLWKGGMSLQEEGVAFFSYSFPAEGDFSVSVDCYDEALNWGSSLTRVSVLSSASDGSNPDFSVTIILPDEVLSGVSYTYLAGVYSQQNLSKCDFYWEDEFEGAMNITGALPNWSATFNKTSPSGGYSNVFVKCTDVFNNFVESIPVSVTVLPWAEEEEPTPAPTPSPTPLPVASVTPTIQGTTPAPSVTAVLTVSPSLAPHAPSPTPYSCPSIPFDVEHEQACKRQGGEFRQYSSFGCPAGYKCLISSGPGEAPSFSPEEKSQEIIHKAKNISIKAEEGVLEALTGTKQATVIALVPNMTYLVYPEQVNPLGRNEVSGVFGSSNHLTNISCISGLRQGPCSCSLRHKLSPELFADKSLLYRVFNCVVNANETGLVNGSYRLLAFDSHGFSNELRDKIVLVPGASSVVTEREVVVTANDPFLTALLALVLLSVVGAVAFQVREKLKSEEEKRNALFKKKAQVENDFKMLKYRFLKRELDEVSFRKIWDAKEKEYSDIKTRILEQQERLKKKSLPPVPKSGK